MEFHPKIPKFHPTVEFHPIWNFPMQKWKIPTLEWTYSTIILFGVEFSTLGQIPTLD